MHYTRSELIWAFRIPDCSQEVDSLGFEKSGLKDQKSDKVTQLLD